MNIFSKLFKKNNNSASTPKSENTQLNKGDTLIEAGKTNAIKVVRPLTEAQKEAIEKSTLLLRNGQLYMHYWTDGLVCTDRNDPEWQNKVMFFWTAEEPFPKKSLPAHFENFKKKYFLFNNDTSTLTVKVGQAIPWFGMPGLGDKYLCEINGENVTVPELSDSGFVEYIEPVELNKDNLEVLNNRENYFLLIDERITPFQNGSFYLNGQPIPIHVAYSVGGIHIVKKAGLS
jgi:hypothetical protein